MTSSAETFLIKVRLRNLETPLVIKFPGKTDHIISVLPWYHSLKIINTVWVATYFPLRCAVIIENSNKNTSNMKVNPLVSHIRSLRKSPAIPYFPTWHKLKLIPGRYPCQRPNFQHKTNLLPGIRWWDDCGCGPAVVCKFFSSFRWAGCG